MTATVPFLLPVLVIMLIGDFMGGNVPGWTYGAVIISSIIWEKP